MSELLTTHTPGTEYTDAAGGTWIARPGNMFSLPGCDDPGRWRTEGEVVEMTGGPLAAKLTTTRTDDGNHTTWAVHTGTRATTLTIARGTPEQITRMILVAPSSAGFADADTAAVLAHVCSHDKLGHGYGWSEPCPYLGRCDRDTYVGTIAHPLFQAAAAAKFDDDAVYELLADLHAKAGA